ncbi:MAG: glutathione peroxidase [Pseudobdellovibrionaceae bacterium]
MSFATFSVKNAQGQNESLEKYKDKVVLVVNVASQCGFTPQYDGLEELYKKYQSQGLVILGFPCNQFGGQEPGSDEDIQSFCRLNHGVTFPVMAKIDVNGSNADPLYQWLKSSAPGILGSEMIKWNFTKFLIGKDGLVIERFAPQTKPQDLVEAIETAMKK